MAWTVTSPRVSGPCAPGPDVHDRGRAYCSPLSPPTKRPPRTRPRSSSRRSAHWTSRQVRRREPCTAPSGIRHTPIRQRLAGIAHLAGPEGDVVRVVSISGWSEPSTRLWSGSRAWDSDSGVGGGTNGDYSSAAHRAGGVRPWRAQPRTGMRHRARLRLPLADLTASAGAHPARHPAVRVARGPRPGRARPAPDAVPGRHGWHDLREQPHRAHLRPGPGRGVEDRPGLQRHGHPLEASFATQGNPLLPPPAYPPARAGCGCLRTSTRSSTTLVSSAGWGCSPGRPAPRRLPAERRSRGGDRRCRRR